MINFEQQEEKSAWNDENTTDILRNSEIMQEQQQQKQQQQQQRDVVDDENKMTARRRIRIHPLPQFASAVNDDAPTQGPSFASVAKALQENVLRSFNHSSPPRERNRSKQKVKNQRQRRRAAPFPGARHTTRESTTHTTTAAAAHNIPIIPTQETEGDVFWNSVKSKMNVGVVAGAIAGGAAGLALAGPAGAYGTCVQLVSTMVLLLL